MPAIVSPQTPPGEARVVGVDLACDGCGYNLRTLGLSGACPECGRPVRESVAHDVAHGVAAVGVGVVGRAERRWALMVLAGLASLLLLYPSMLWIVLNMQFADVAFGTAPRLNVPGPKVWAVPLVQRSIGGHAEWLGAQGTWLPMMSLLAIGLITAPRRSVEAASPRVIVFRLATRWACVVLLAGFFGFLMNAEDTYSNDIAVGKYAMLGVMGVELPCTALLFGYLAYLAHALSAPAVRRRLLLALLGTIVSQCAGIAMANVAGAYADQRKDLLVQAWSACYEAFCCAVSLLTIGGMAGLMGLLARCVLPVRWGDWLA